MTNFLVGAAAGLLIAWLYSRWATWMSRHMWEVEPTEATEIARKRFFSRMTWDGLMKFKAMLDAELAKRRP